MSPPTNKNGYLQKTHAKYIHNHHEKPNSYGHLANFRTLTAAFRAPYFP